MQFIGVLGSVLTAGDKSGKRPGLQGHWSTCVVLVQSLVAVCGGPADVVSALRVYSLGKKTDIKHGMELKLTS